MKSIYLAPKSVQEVFKLCEEKREAEQRLIDVPSGHHPYSLSLDLQKIKQNLSVAVNDLRRTFKIVK